MRVVAADPTAQLEKHCRAVLVGGNRRTKRQETEILQHVVDWIKRWITGLPSSVALPEPIGRHRAEPEQVVTAIHHHVDGEIVAGEDLELRANRIAQLKALPLQFPAQ